MHALPTECYCGVRTGRPRYAVSWPPAVHALRETPSMATSRQPHPSRAPAGTALPPLESYPTGEFKPMPSYQHGLTLTLIYRLLWDLLAPRHLVAYDLLIL